MSRRRTTLTGGTGDVSPQFANFTATQSGADTTTTTSFAVPIQRLPAGNQAQVMEVLKIFWRIAGTVVETDNTVSGFFSTTSFGTTATNFAEPRVFGHVFRSVNITTSGQIVVQEPYVQDLTDGAGHGVLIATDNIFLQVVSGTTSATNTIYAKILYRWKNVPLAEYIGIVQSQQ